MPILTMFLAVFLAVPILLVSSGKTWAKIVAGTLISLGVFLWYARSLRARWPAPVLPYLNGLAQISSALSLMCWTSWPWSSPTRSRRYVSHPPR